MRARGASAVRGEAARKARRWGAPLGARARARGPWSLTLFLAAATVAPLGCELILGIEDIEHGPPGDACWDPKGLAGRGCYRAGEPGCPITDADPAETNRRIINACTPAACVPFTAELSKLLPGGGLPSLPSPTGGGGGAGGESGSGGGGGNGDGGGTGGGGGSGTGGGGGNGTGGGGGSGGGGVPTKCSDLPAPRIYMTGSNAVAPLLQQAAPKLANVTIIYQPQSSCVGFEKIAYNERIEGEARYYVTPAAGDETDTGERACVLDEGGNSVDIGACDVFAATCTTSVVGNNFLDYGSGPIQAFTLVVPQKSSQEVISREAAYLVYGFGAESGVAPWTDGDRIYQRDNRSGTKRMIAGAIDVPYDLWKGTELANTAAMKAAMKSANDEDQAAADATLGILDVINDNDAKGYLKILAYQAREQRCGFLPDAEAGLEDKKNVRDGHYDIWGPLHFFVKASNGMPTSDTATSVVNSLTGFKPLPNEDKFAYTIVSTQAKGSLIPRCAMRVNRTSELGPLTPYAADFPCGCYFEQEATGAPSAGCKACAQQGECAAQTEVCSFGFCEPR